MNIEKFDLYKKVIFAFSYLKQFNKIDDFLIQPWILRAVVKPGLSKFILATANKCEFSIQNPKKSCFK